VRISTLRPTLDANGVKLVGVGLEQLGAEEFVKQRFLDGEVYVDEKKKTYEDLGYKRFNWLNIWKALLSAISRKAVSNAKAENISGNLSGDGLQNGGLLIVTKGGEQVLLNHREETPGDHVANAVILEALGLKQENASKSPAGEGPQECTTTCVDDATLASEVPEQECTTTCAIESNKKKF
jgi:prostamide/prostaglandin F2alpha synthase